jgi:predicted dehydrogenase
LTGVGIVGCGLIGKKRAAALAGATLVVCADIAAANAEALACATGAAWSTDWSAVIGDPRVDIVVVSTTNDMLTAVAAAAVDAGKHVLIEKPAGRSVAELAPLVERARARGVLVRVGFNHRYHPAMQRARMLLDAGDLGPVMFVRGRYGHGGRVGYDREWRARPEIAGGGELMDQGVHLIDLARWFLGDFTEVDGVARTYFWNMAVDDNAFMRLTTVDGKTAFLHVSCTEWKNLFSLEIYARTAKLHVEGLGGSYGVERLALYRMRPEMGPPDTTIWEYPGPDRSWFSEFEEFLEDIRIGRQPSAGLDSAHAALAVVEEIYRRSGYPIMA